MPAPRSSSNAGRTRILVTAAAVLGLAVIPLFFLLPVDSFGETLADDAEAVAAVALAVAVLAACLPAVLSGRRQHIAAWTCGILLLAGSFVTVLGMFFIPAGLLLCLAGFTGRDTAGERSAEP